MSQIEFVRCRVDLPTNKIFNFISCTAGAALIIKVQVMLLVKMFSTCDDPRVFLRKEFGIR